MNAFYAVIRFLVLLYYKLIYFAVVEGVENVPSEGGFVICSNHKSNNDPPLIAVLLPRQLKFLAKKELFKNKLIGHFLKSIGAISLNRGAADISAVKHCMSVLKKGYGLLVFPQGKRLQRLELKDFHGGSILIAQRMNVPIVPAYISGEYKPFHRTKLILGKQIMPETVNKLAEESENKEKAAAELIYSSISSLSKG